MCEREREREMFHLVPHDLLDDIEHSPGCREHQTAVMLGSEVLQQSDDKHNFARLFNQQVVRYVTDVKHAWVLSHGSIKRVNVHTAQIHSSQST